MFELLILEIGVVLALIAGTIAAVASLLGSIEARTTMRLLSDLAEAKRS